jgi:hypothetical protein
VGDRDATSGIILGKDAIFRSGHLVRPPEFHITVEKRLQNGRYEKRASPHDLVGRE